MLGNAWCGTKSNSNSMLSLTPFVSSHHSAVKFRSSERWKVKLTHSNRLVTSQGKFGFLLEASSTERKLPYIQDEDSHCQKIKTFTLWYIFTFYLLIWSNSRTAVNFIYKLTMINLRYLAASSLHCGRLLHLTSPVHQHVPIVKMPICFYHSQAH